MKTSRLMIEMTNVNVVVNDIQLLPRTNLGATAGQVTAIRGHNGSGKSTLLRVLDGSYAPTEGSALVAGRDPRLRDAKSRRCTASMIGLPPMAPDLTVRDHVELVASTWYDDAEEVSDAADGILELLRLRDLDKRFPHELSSGQMQLFGLALILVRPSEVLLLDEPEQRLDPQRLGYVIDALRQVRDAGTAIIIATHSDVLSSELADSVVWLRATG
ncbi:ATP-binding cassette domain-containing protein [Microbacterium sp. VKM Ac-2923]|uniref:ABC transporter ATP-binding protein n=1 Tax=Microbacterium sp. VKM Ac-2923 TaxID=2929476 RepID=UPI001FB2CA77|nr:ATP-binding cassette domain-containing protein [Microbacterium sp. VKM Ac-2923]MCJ1707111.1 ATP-binding cassette domain-containing protein [Microbacterium sp. VKM Ac-2923]